MDRTTRKTAVTEIAIDSADSFYYNRKKIITLLSINTDNN